MDMTEKVFENTTYGKIALKKFGNVSDNFRIYECGWLSEDWKVMQVRGAEFREVTRGRNKGKLSILVKGTERSVYVTREEIK